MDHSARPICAISTVTTEHTVPEHASSRAGRIQSGGSAKLSVHPNPSTRARYADDGRGVRVLVDMCEGANLNHWSRSTCALARSRMHEVHLWFRESL